MAAGIRFVPLGDIAMFHIIYGSAATWLAGSAACDLLIAVSMVFLLSSARKRSFSERTERMITRLIRMTVETGVVTATAAILDLAFFLGTPENNLHLLMALILSKLYTNTLYASLNSRAGIFTDEESNITDTASRGRSGFATSFRMPHSTNPGLHSHTNTVQPVIHVDRITEVSDPNGDSKLAHSDKDSSIRSIPMIKFPPTFTSNGNDLRNSLSSA